MNQRRQYGGQQGHYYGFFILEITLQIIDTGMIYVILNLASIRSLIASCQVILKVQRVTTITTNNTIIYSWIVFGFQADDGIMLTIGQEKQGIQSLLQGIGKYCMINNTLGGLVVLLCPRLAGRPHILACFPSSSGHKSDKPYI